MKHLVAILTAFIMCLLVAGSAGAEDAKSVKWLFVHTAESAEMVSDTTLIMPVEREIFAFTDRPNRRHAYLTAKRFAGLWAESKGDSFEVDPPNAELTWVVGDIVREAEVVITDAKASADGKSIVYGLKFEVGEEPPQTALIHAVMVYVDDADWCCAVEHGDR